MYSLPVKDPVTVSKMNIKKSLFDIQTVTNINQSYVLKLFPLNYALKLHIHVSHTIITSGSCIFISALTTIAIPLTNTQS